MSSPVLLPNDPDAALVLEARAGNRRAFEDLVVRYQKPIYNAALRILNDRDEAKDVAQTVFLKAFENLGRYDPNQRFFSWIYRIGVNEALDVVARRKRHEAVPDDLVAERADPADIAVKDQIDGSVQAALMALKVEYRTVIVLKHIMGCSYDEIGAILEVPEKTVKSRLFTARQALRDVMVARGLI
jgi:RNA polymerase sigma-70 factor (ECF subfamily)